MTHGAFRGGNSNNFKNLNILKLRTEIFKFLSLQREKSRRVLVQIHVGYWSYRLWADVFPPLTVLSSLLPPLPLWGQVQRWSSQTATRHQSSFPQPWYHLRSHAYRHRDTWWSETHTYTLVFTQKVGVTDVSKGKSLENRRTVSWTVTHFPSTVNHQLPFVYWMSHRMSNLYHCPQIRPILIHDLSIKYRFVLTAMSALWATLPDVCWNIHDESHTNTEGQKTESTFSSQLLGLCAFNCKMTGSLCVCVFCPEHLSTQISTELCYSMPRLTVKHMPDPECSGKHTHDINQSSVIQFPRLGYTLNKCSNSFGFIVAFWCCSKKRKIS